LAALDAEDGLSFSQISSDNLWNLIYTCMDKVRNQYNKQPILDSMSIIQKPSSKDISKLIKKEAEKEKNKFKDLNGDFGTLSFDGGEFAGRNYFVGIISFCYKPESTCILACFEEDIRTQEDMACVCAESINRVYPYIRIINISTDGLLHQVQAMHLFPTSTLENYQNFLKHPNEAKAYYVPDIPHLLQLSLTTGCKKTICHSWRNL
jgi:hypothetical protein